jgi:DNA-binding NarL/FixJ family response regulator
VLLADDHVLVREGVRAILEKQRDIVVVGEASDGLQMVRQFRSLTPDVIIADIAMPNLSGIAAIRRLRQAGSTVGAIILSMHSTAKHVHDALHAGADGYLLKQSVSTELIEAIRVVASGHRYLSPGISDILVRNHAIEREPGVTAAPSSLDSLSPREREVLQLVVEGMTSATIAQLLHLSPSTVDTYRSRMMRKLGVGSIAELVRLAMQSGLSPHDE